jgi:lipopolysaccharide export system protein LptA
MNLRLLITFFIISFLSFVSVIAQEGKEARVQYRAETVEVNKNIGDGAQRLLGNVEFIHAGAKMYCDSAYFYSKKNSLDAYNDILINQGDTIFLYGDYLHYNGNTKKATVTGHVKLVNKETVLTTSELDYKLDSGIAYYTNYALTINKENTLESIKGYYYTQLKTVVFYDSVIIVTPDYKMYSDTVRYNTFNGVAKFFGPTNIIGDSSQMYGEKGWYDTELDIAQIEKDAWAKKKEQTIFGQFIFYDKNTGEGVAKNNVRILEQEKNVMLTGNSALYNDITEYAFITDSARFIQFADGDSLFLHADTLELKHDTIGNRMIFAFHNVRFFRDDLQGKCDSLVYTFSDSTARLFDAPVLWAQNYQMSADFIEIITKNQKIDKMYLLNSAFIASKEDTSYYSQIKGKDMTCFFKNDMLTQIDVNGNGQTVYYPKEEEDIVGVNLSECSNIKILLKEGELYKINFYKNPKGGMYPLDQAPENRLLLKGFVWQESVRPKSKNDIF